MNIPSTVEYFHDSFYEANSVSIPRAVVKFDFDTELQSVTSVVVSNF